MLCPRDRIDIEGTTIGGISVDMCPRCKGIWFDGGELERVVQEYREEAIEQGKAVSDADTKETPIIVEKTDMQWVCPKDGTLLERVAYSGDRGTVVERCDSCGGWWFDNDDLGRAKMLHVPRPAIERAAALMIGEENRIELERKETQERFAAIARSLAAITQPYGIFLFLAEVLRAVIAEVQQRQRSK